VKRFDEWNERSEGGYSLDILTLRLSSSSIEDKYKSLSDIEEFGGQEGCSPETSP
jgi:hypothetical protein